jgi:hypothetical protein
VSFWASRLLASLEAEPDYWFEWLSKAFGPSLAQQHKNGAEQMSTEIIAYLYLVCASRYIIRLALIVFGFCLVVMRQIHPEDAKRSGILLVQKFWTGRDFSPEGKLLYLFSIGIPRPLYNNLGEQTGISNGKYSISFFNIFIILVLLI